MKTEKIYLAGGCFWGAQKYFDCLTGVLETRVGYANGRTENPTYEQVKYQHTGHAETVEVTFDPAVLSLTELLEQFYKAIDPTSVNRQGGDVGEQYRTGVYYENPDQEPVIRASLAALQARCEGEVAIQCRKLEQFFPAEEYHQKYLEKNPGGYCHIGPALFQSARDYRPGKKDGGANKSDR